MLQKRYKFHLPDGWQIVKPAQYKKYSILSTKHAMCMCGFLAENDDDHYVVGLFDNGKYYDGVFDEYEKEVEYIENNNVSNLFNNFLADNADGFSVPQLTQVKSLFHKTEKFQGKEVFTHIIEYQTSVGKHYGVAFYVKVDESADRVLAVLTAIPTLDTSRPMESAIESYKFIDVIINVFIKNMRIEMIDE